MSSSLDTSCVYFPRCRGCDYWDIHIDQQKELKIQNLKTILNQAKLDLGEIDFVHLKPYGLRHRLDFTFTNNPNEDQIKFGLYDQQKSLVDLPVCLQLAPELQKVLTEFRSFKMKTQTRPILKASVRLRVGPQGLKGVWLDLANIDIKELLFDARYLTELLESDFKVEIGQKGKSLQKTSGGLKLLDPKPEVWFQTFDRHGQSLPMKGLVSDFTQPSWLSGQKLTEIVLEWISKEDQHVIEFGSGLGQFTLALLSEKINVQAFEVDENLVENLKHQVGKLGFTKYFEIQKGDFQNNQPDLRSEDNLENKVVLVNPSRSGLKNFVHPILELQAKKCIYVSCFPESMALDLAVLVNAGYKIEQIKIVDQFPQTKHYETCVLLKKLL